MSRGRTPMRKIRQVLEYRLSKNISAEQTSLALSLSKGSVINYVERFEQSKLPWPLPDTLTDTALEQALFPPSPPSNDAPIEPLPILGVSHKRLDSRVGTLSSFEFASR